MKKFISFINSISDINDINDINNISEAKNIGILYHFTKGFNLQKIVNGSELIEPFHLISYNGVISTSRNAYMNTDIFTDNGFNQKNGYIVRIALDGNKLSHKYKIKPLAGYFDNDTEVFNHKKNHKRIERTSGEHEEAILHKKINILPYIKQIDIVRIDDYAVELFNSVKDELQKLNIQINLVRKLALVENTLKNEFLGIELE